MKLFTALFFVSLLPALSQVRSTPVAIKSRCFLVASVQFSPDGGQLARLCMFDPVAIFDTANVHKAYTFLPEAEHTPQLQSLAYSPNGKLIATAEGWSGALIWNAADPGKPRPDYASFIGVDELHVWDKPMRVLLAPAAGSHNTSDLDERVDWIRFSPDGKHLLTGHGNGHVQIWNTSSWHREGELPIATGDVRGAAITPDSKAVMVAQRDGVLHEWSLERKVEIRTLRTVQQISNLEFSPDGKTLVASHMGRTFADASVIIWNTSKWKAQTEEGYSCATFARRGGLLALGGTDHVTLIEPSSLKEIGRLTLPETSNRDLFRDPKQPNSNNANKRMPPVVSALAFSPKGNVLAAGTLEGTVYLLNTTLAE